jgi:hypothetical protein
VGDTPASSEDAVDEALAALYSESPEDFVAARNRMVRELRARGERDLAARVAALRRPTLSLWLANRLHEAAPDQLEELLAAGGELQAAQAAAAGGDAGARRRFRELIGRHSQLIDGLVRRGLGLAEERGHGAGDEVSRRLAATLRAASTEPGESGRRLLEGRLAAEPEAGGFGLVSGPAPGPAGETEAAGALEGGPDEPGAVGLDVAARAAEARLRATEKERAAVAARSRAQELRQRADALAKQARSAREEADAAEAEALAADTVAAEAKRAADEAKPPRGT